MASEFGSMEFEKKLKIFNEYYAYTSSWKITSMMLDDEQVLEGRLRIHWGILNPIRLKQKDDGEPSPSDGSFEADFSLNTSFDTMPSPRHVQNGRRIDRTSTLPRGPRGDSDLTRYGSVVMRGETKYRRVKKRLSVLNGHIYNTETSLFVPTFGSASNVFISSRDSCSRVLKQLLDKFKVENGPENFCLCVVKHNDERITLSDDDFPLIQRIIHGPDEEVAKFFIMEKIRVMNINEQVAQFMNLPEAVLVGFLHKLKNDEECEVALIRERRNNIRRRILQQMDKLNESTA